jgi:nucleoredoxin
MVDTASAMQDKKAVALYFSAHWCPPCRGFTPQLAEWYTNDLQAKGLEVVFVSSDRDEAAFSEYYGEQPWLALPYSDRDKKNELSKMYKVNGIPSLVIVDPATGATITTDGRAAVSEDPTGEKMPWTPPTKEEKRQAAINALGDEFEDKDGATFNKAERLNKEFIGLYFSAHWCPPCRNFTPKLAQNYSEGLSDKMEIVFVSSDRDESAFKEYLGEMPWLALPYAKREQKNTLSKVFGVEGIPKFVVMDKEFNVITTEGTSCIGRDGKGETLPDGWKPQPFGDCNQDPSALNDSTCVLAMGSSAGGIEEVAKEYYKQAGEEVDEMKYRFYTCPEGQVESQIRKLTNTTDAGDCLVLLDIPDDGAFYKIGTDISAAAIREAIKKLEGKELERSQLSRG